MNWNKQVESVRIIEGAVVFHLWVIIFSERLPFPCLVHDARVLLDGGLRGVTNTNCHAFCHRYLSLFNVKLAILNSFSMEPENCSILYYPAYEFEHYVIQATSRPVLP